MTRLRVATTILAMIALPIAPGLARSDKSPHPTTRTAGGIRLGEHWRQVVYTHAVERFKHPAWGWRHSERDYLLAMQLASKENMIVDEDVLFAAAFLHDAGAIEPFARDGVDHAERSVQLAEPLLRDAGFPMGKFPAVRAAILGHMFDKTPGNSAEAVVLHDADTLDFLGATGVARRLSVTGSATEMDAGIERIELFAAELGARLITRTAIRTGRQRIKTMKRFLMDLKMETPRDATL